MNFYLILDGQRKKKPSVLCIITMTRKQNTYEYISPDKNVTGIFGHKYLPYFYMKEFQIFICSISYSTIDIKQNEINPQIKAILQIHNIWNLQDNKMLFSSEAESVELTRKL